MCISSYSSTTVDIRKKTIEMQNKKYSINCLKILPVSFAPMYISPFSCSFSGPRTVANHFITVRLRCTFHSAP